VQQGSGRTEIDGTSYSWSKGDVLVIAPAAVHKHANPGRERAILFHVTDVPLLKALGFYQEEAV
ncbi:MAG: cupin domain-containing protein, partial [Terracidiphilus sp.]